MSAFIKDLFSAINKNKVMQICISVACLTAFFVANDRKFPMVKYGDFELSPEFFPITLLIIGIFFAAYFVANLIILFEKNITNGISNKKQHNEILKTLEEMTFDEKKFFFYRLYMCGNEAYINLKNDDYFYDAVALGEYKLRKFKNEAEKGIFIRTLENKGLLEETGNQTMRIPELVWTVLKENANVIFKNFDEIDIRTQK